MTPNSPLKSALKVPGTPGRLNPLSPTFKEEQILEKSEEKTEKENAKDLVGSQNAKKIHSNANDIFRKPRPESAWPKCACA